MLIDCIVGLEAGHLRVLQVMEAQANPDNPDVGWTAERVAREVGDQLSPVGLRSAIEGLLGRGLVESPSGFGGGSIYKITEFGRAMPDALRWSSRTVG